MNCTTVDSIMRDAAAPDGVGPPSPAFPVRQNGAMELPEPACAFGYSFAQLHKLLGDDSFALFEEHILHRTVTICNGEECSESHGRVAFVRDVKGFVLVLDAV